MSYHHFYKKLEATAQRLFPGLAEIAAPTWDHLISPLEIKLSPGILKTAREAIESLHQISRKPSYAAAIEPVSGVSDISTAYESVLMAYDFHCNEAGDLFLVEINTNASGYMLSAVMEMAHAEGESSTFAESPALKLLQQSFAKELTRGGKSVDGAKIAITDEDIPQQKMFAEFLMYRDWFRACGWTAEFCEGRDFVLNDGQLGGPNLSSIDLVYNRLTDFYLQAPAHAALQRGFAEGAAVVSPNPREYWLLADKQRLIDMTAADFMIKVGASTEEIERINKVLIPTFEKTAFGSAEEIWAQRRGLFFKPKRSHGGKSVYRGESVSRKVFERLMLEDILIQKFSPAQKMPTDDPRSVLTNWKFDLRFYVYGNQIHQAVARIYQGQVTNFASPLGGFTRVQF